MTPKPRPAQQKWNEEFVLLLSSTEEFKNYLLTKGDTNSVLYYYKEGHSVRTAVERFINYRKTGKR